MEVFWFLRQSLFSTTVNTLWVPIIARRRHRRLTLGWCRVARRALPALAQLALVVLLGCYAVVLLGLPISSPCLVTPETSRDAARQVANCLSRTLTRIPRGCSKSSKRCGSAWRPQQGLAIPYGRGYHYWNLVLYVLLLSSLKAIAETPCSGEQHNLPLFSFQSLYASVNNFITHWWLLLVAFAYGRSFSAPSAKFRASSYVNQYMESHNAISAVVTQVQTAYIALAACLIFSTHKEISPWPSQLKSSRTHRLH